jgi:hypothetical protein
MLLHHSHRYIGEFDLKFEITSDDRYLKDFVTLPDWQGFGLYPRMLQTESMKAREILD